MWFEIPMFFLRGTPRSHLGSGSKDPGLKFASGQPLPAPVSLGGAQVRPAAAFRAQKYKKPPIGTRWGGLPASNLVLLQLQGVVCFLTVLCNVT